MTDLNKCKCGHISSWRDICYRCRKSKHITVIGQIEDIERLKQLKFLASLDNATLSNFIESIAENCICEERCPISDICPQNIKAHWNVDRTIKYCYNRLMDWWRGKLE